MVCIVHCARFESQLFILKFRAVIKILEAIKISLCEAFSKFASAQRYSGHLK